jgi:hypothetical protein
MNKLLASKRRLPSGDTKTWQLQELSFMHIQLMRMGRAKQTATRKDLSFTVAACHSNKGWVAQRTRLMSVCGSDIALFLDVGRARTQKRSACSRTMVP